MFKAIAFRSYNPVSFTAKNENSKKTKPQRAGLTKTTALVGLTALSSIGMAQVAKANDSKLINADSTKAGQVSQDLVFNQKCEDAILKTQESLGLKADSAEIANLRTFVENNQELIKKVMEAESPEELEELINKSKENNDDGAKALILAFLITAGLMGGSYGLVKAVYNYCDE